MSMCTVCLPGHFVASIMLSEWPYSKYVRKAEAWGTTIEYKVRKTPFTV